MTQLISSPPERCCGSPVESSGSGSMSDISLPAEAHKFNAESNVELGVPTSLLEGVNRVGTVVAAMDHDDHNAVIDTHRMLFLEAPTEILPHEITPGASHTLEEAVATEHVRYDQRIGEESAPEYARATPDPSIRLVAFGETIRSASFDEDIDKSIRCADDWSQSQSDRLSWLRLVCQRPLQILRSVRPIQHSSLGSTLSSTSGIKRSSLRAGASSKWRFLPKKRVRFKSVLSPWAATVMSFVTASCSEGSSLLFWWDRITAFFNAADFLILPLAALAREYVTAKPEWVHRYGTQAAERAVAKYYVWSHLELAFDSVFLIDVLVRFARAWVQDMGFELSTADRLVAAAPDQSASAVTKGDHRGSAPQAQYAIESWLRIGPALRVQLGASIPMRILLMLPLWVVHGRKHVSNAILNVAALARCYRLFDLMLFFAARQEDVAEDVQWIAFCKFAFIIYSTGHWLGCLYYMLAAYTAFDTSQFRLNWVDAWVQQTSVDFSWLDASPAYDYVVMLFKGFSVLTTLGYEVAVPERMEEVVLSLVAQNIKVIIYAYILGTLFHYLVKKDPELEATRDLMAGLISYCKERALPSELTKKMEAHLVFQQSKSSAVSSGVLQSLPMSLKSRIAKAKCEDTIFRNMHIFNTCNEQFLYSLMMALVEVSLMPEELVVKQGDMARQLCFAIKGTLVVRDGNAVLIEFLTGEGTAPCAAGAVSFLLGVPEPYSVYAREDEDTAVLILTKADYDAVIANYPEQSDVILTNMLLQYGLTRVGEEIGTKGFDQRTDEEGYAQLRHAIQCEIKRSQETALADLTYAASNGFVDTVKHLVARGIPIDAGDYDGRTALHLAIAEGQVHVVKMLLDMGASVHVVDRWGSTPLLEALKLSNRPIAELLVEKGASVNADSFSLVKEAAENDSALLQLTCMKAGVDPHSCDYDGRSVLHTLCAAGDFKAVEGLLSLGLDVNVVDRWNSTPMQDAVQAGSKLIIALLKKSGGRVLPSLVSDAWFQAARCGDIVRLNLLLEAGADARMCNYDKITALHVAAGAGQPLTLYRLITCHAVDVNLLDIWGLTPLDHAVREEHWSCAVLLISNAGECKHKDLQKKLDGALQQKLLPNLMAVRERLSDAICSERPEIEIMGSTAIQSCDAALSVRRHVFDQTIKVLPEMLQSAESMKTLLHESHSLIKAVQALVDLVTPSSPVQRFSEGYRSQNVRMGEESGSAPRLSAAIVKISMTALLRSSMALDTVRHLAAEVGDHLNSFEPSVAQTCQMLTGLGLKTEPHQIGTMDTALLLFGAPGVRQLSLARLIAWPYFRHRVQLEAKQLESGRSQSAVLSVGASSARNSTKLHGKAARRLKARLSAKSMSRSTSNSVCKVHPAPEQPVPVRQRQGAVKTIVLRLNTLYKWIAEAFAVLDPDNIGYVCMETHGPSIQGSLAEAGLEQLWDSLLSECQDAMLTKDAFVKVYITWMGLSDGSAVVEGLQRSRCVEIADAEQGSVMSAVEASNPSDEPDHLDDSDYEDLDDLEELVLLKNMVAEFRERAFLAMMVLSPLQRLMWAFGAKLSRTEMAVRAFNFIDDNGNSTISIDAMELLFKIVQDELPVTKASFDFVEKLKADCTRDSKRSVTLEDVTAFFQTIPSARVRPRMPPDAHWGVCHPNSRPLLIWDIFIRTVSLYFFWEVPLNISFQTSRRLGSAYEYANLTLEGLLIVDMIINIFRAFYDDQGVLRYNLKAIRGRYINGSFFLDLLAAMPFGILVQINGNVNYGYASWLRIPKMLRIYRMLNVYKQMGHSVSQMSVSVRILQLMPLILGLIHLYGCIWWYIGTVGRSLSYTENMTLTGSWIYYYAGLGNEFIWRDDVPIQKQYLLSCYWAASTLSTASLVDAMTPKNVVEVLFTIWSMLTTLTVYAFVVGEISNAVMANDQALVSMREEVSRVQTFLARHRLPRDLAVDIVNTFEDSLNNNAYSAQQIHSLMSSSLRVEVAMHMSLPLLKGNRIFAHCSSGFLAGLSVQLREIVLASDEYLFHDNEICDELYLISSSSIDILTRGVNGNEVVTETRIRGDVVGEMAFFFRLRHLHTACVGRTRATVFVLPYNDYKQLAATYVDDDATVLASLANSIELLGSQEPQAREGAHAPDQLPAKDRHGRFMQKVEDAMQRRADQHVVKLLHAVADSDVPLVRHMLTNGTIAIDAGDYDERTALHVAACGGDMAMLKMLVEQYKANHRARDRTGCTPLDDAVRHRQMPAVQYLAQLEDGPVLSVMRYVANTIQAAADDDIEYMKVVTEAGMDLNCMDQNNRTPLHLAAANSSMRVLKFLVHQPSVRLGPLDNMGHTPVWNSIVNGDCEAVALLRSRGAPVQQDLSKALCDAASRNDTRVFELILAHDIDPLSRDAYGRTALHVAATSNSLEVVSMLCKAKTADVNPLDGFGNTPLDNANMVGSKPIAALLERAGARPGSDESLVSLSQEVRDWVSRHVRAQQQMHLDQVLAKLPEKQQATQAATAVRCQSEFVQATYVNMQILACCLRESLPSRVHSSRSLKGSRASHARLLLVLQALIRQFCLLEDLLKGKPRGFSVLQSFPFRAVASHCLGNLSEKICHDVNGVARTLQSLEQRVQNRCFSIPNDNEATLTKMLDVGVLQYLRLPVPVLSNWGLTLSYDEVREWSLNPAISESHQAGKEDVFVRRKA